MALYEKTTSGIFARKHESNMENNVNSFFAVYILLFLVACSGVVYIPIYLNLSVSSSLFWCLMCKTIGICIVTEESEAI